MRAVLANLPTIYDFSLLRETPDNMAKASLPYCDCILLISEMVESMASSQEIGTKPTPGLFRIGAVKRSSWLFCMYLKTPFGQSLPSLKGNSIQGSKPTTLLFFANNLIPHCIPQKQQ